MLAILLSLDEKYHQCTSNLCSYEKLLLENMSTEHLTLLSKQKLHPLGS